MKGISCRPHVHISCAYNLCVLIKTFTTEHLLLMKKYKNRFVMKVHQIDTLLTIIHLFVLQKKSLRSKGDNKTECLMR